ncbi:hypothetical protein NKG05_21130 [Oerskovia sp. M15]
MLLWAPFQAMYRLAVKRPGQARDELLAPVWAVFRVRAVTRSRRSVRRTSVLPRRALTPLRGTWRDVLSERRDHRLARAEQHRTSAAPTDLERAELGVLARRRRAMLAVLTVALLGVTAVVFGTVIATLGAGGRLVGGALLPAQGMSGPSGTRLPEDGSRPGSVPRLRPTRSRRCSCPWRSWVAASCSRRSVSWSCWHSWSRASVPGSPRAD